MGNLVENLNLDKRVSSLVRLFLRYFIDFLNNGYDVIDR